MKLFFIVTCLLSAFVFKGHALTCITCTGATSAGCTGPAANCTSTEDSCIFIFTETKVLAFGITSYAVQRGCGSASICEQPKSLSNQFMTVNTNVTCCNMDNCTPATPQFTSFSAAKNGQECPSCFSLTSATCVPENNISCTGLENTCTSYSMTSADVPSKPILAMSGCATQSLCTNFNGTASTTTTGQIKISIKCTKTIVSTGSTTVTPTLTSNPHGISESVSQEYTILTSTGARVTSLESSRTDDQTYHYTTGIANPDSNTTLPMNYTTRITFTPTIFHSVTQQPASSCCVCSGSAKLSCSLSLVLILMLIKCLY